MSGWIDHFLGGGTGDGGGGQGPPGPPGADAADSRDVEIAIVPGTYSYNLPTAPRNLDAVTAWLGAPDGQLKIPRANLTLSGTLITISPVAYPNLEADEILSVRYQEA